MQQSKRIIEVKELNVNYLGYQALTNVSFQVSMGQMIGIIGPNGAGKSSLIKGMLGLAKATGEVFIDGKKPKELGSQIAYMKQGSDFDLNFPLLVQDVVMLGLYPQLGLFKRPKKEHWRLVEKALKKVELEDFSHRQISALSGGQWQRVLMARMLVQDADVLFLDEPFTGIDIFSETKIMDVLRQLCHEGKTIVMVYHDLEKAKDYFDQVVLLNKTIVAFGEREAIFTDELLKSTYLKGA